MLRDWPKVYGRLRRMRGRNEKERVRLANALAATPDERRALNVKKLKELVFWGRGIQGSRDFETHVLKPGVPTWT